jgi:hypothetical protein
MLSFLIIHAEVTRNEPAASWDTNKLISHLWYTRQTGQHQTRGPLFSTCNVILLMACSFSNAITESASSIKSWKLHSRNFRICFREKFSQTPPNGRNHKGDLGVNGRIISQWISKEQSVKVRGLDSSGCRQGPAVGSLEHDNGPWGSIKGG